MDPNSQNQIWSEWTWFVVPGSPIVLTDKEYFETVRADFARFAREQFGSAGKARVTQVMRGFVFEALIEGHPIGDERFREIVRKTSERRFKKLFGESTLVTMEAKLMAGKRDDGKPPDQMLLLPSRR